MKPTIRSGRYRRSMPELRSVCVYCASSTGSNDRIVAATKELGEILAARGIRLVYGGGAVGLMGLIADTVLDAGGEVTGIIPLALFPKEVAHQRCTELITVDSMHDRKRMMFEHADGFIALPGGFGTLEELAEMVTWAQIGLHAKPVGVLNVDGYWDGLLGFFERATRDRLLKEQNRQLLLEATTPSAMLDALERYEGSAEPKWIAPTPETDPW